VDKVVEVVEVDEVGEVGPLIPSATHRKPVHRSGTAGPSGRGGPGRPDGHGSFTRAASHRARGARGSWYMERLTVN